MISYFSIFPEKYATEIRTVAFPNHRDMPAGTILFNEYFCPDHNCNCERILIRCDQVLDQNSAPNPYAMISYSWNSKPDAPWRKIISDGNPILDPFHTNKKFAYELMEFWYDMYQRDGDYRERIFRHYRELRNAVGMQFTTKEGSGISPEMRKTVASMVEASLAGNTKLLTNPAEIKKIDRLRHKALKRKRANRRKPK